MRCADLIRMSVFSCRERETIAEYCVGVISLTDIAKTESRQRAGAVLQAVTRERS